jgi:hypothetical protein
MSFIVMVETAHVDRGKVTTSDNKQAIKRPNKLLEGHQEDIDITKKQNDD